MKYLKAFIISFLLLCTSLSLTACNTNGDLSGKKTGEGSGILVVYFSCTNNTKGVAETLQYDLNADIYRIVPKDPYSSADLNYNNNSCRANQEQNDESSRPEIDGTIENIKDYDTIYLGYPIWWGKAPRIIQTFLESYDFNGITIIPFCTSGSSGIGTSATSIHSCALNAVWKDGTVVRSESDINKLVNMR